MVEPKKKSSIQKIDANGSNLDLTNGKANIMKNSNTSEKKTKPVEKVTMPAKGNGNLILTKEIKTKEDYLTIFQEMDIQSTINFYDKVQRLGKMEGDSI